MSNQFKPAILQCFGDIAGAIGGHFETYLAVVAQVLQQAAIVIAAPEGSYEMFDYVISLREGIMDAWGGIIGAMKTSHKGRLLAIPLTVLMALTHEQLNLFNHTSNLFSRFSMSLPTTTTAAKR